MANKISQIKLPDNNTYDINASTVSNHTVGVDVPANGVTYYGTSVTGASTVNKKATCDEFTTPMESCPAGTSVRVMFNYGNTAEAPTLNINSQGAKPIIRYGTTEPGTNKYYSWRDGSIITFTYDGTNWVMNDVQDTASALKIANKEYTSAETCVPLFVDGATDGGVYTPLVNNGLKYLNLNGTESDNGYAVLTLGNSTDSGTAGNKYGAIRLCGKTGSKYATLKSSDTTSSNSEQTFPTTSGTVLNTGTTSYSQTYANTGTKIGTITINNTATDIYAPTPPTVGTAAAKNYTTSVTSGSADLVTSGAVYTAIDNLPEPMVFKGSLGTGGTITALPVNGTAAIGDTYKVITAGTYASQSADVGDTFICDSKTSSANTWVLIPSGDEPSGTVTSVTIKGTSPIVSSNSSAITSSGTRTISHATSGVTAGTYQSVTVDTYGHVTAGTNPTTLAGYGITDAKIASGVITLGSNTITPLTSSSSLNAAKLTGTVPSGCYTNTTYESKTAASGGTDVSLVTTGEKYTWNNKTSNTGTVTKVTAGTGLTGGDITTTGTIAVSYGSTAGTACQGNDSRLSDARPSSDVVQTYSSSSTVPISGKGVAAAIGGLDGTVSGTAGAGKTLTAFSQTDGKVSATFGNISITKSQVSDLGTIGTAAAKDYVTSVDTSASLPTSNAVKTFVENKGYVTTDTKNTAGSTDTSSKIYLVGATSQAANPQTYSDNEVYATSGVLTTKSVQVGGASGGTMQYDSSTQSISFIFA